MYARMINEHEIETAIPRTAVVDGALIGNVASKPEILAHMGFWPLIETERPEGDYRAVYAFDGAHIVRGWEAYTPPETVRTYSKYKITSALISIGKWEAFVAALTAEQRALWDAATVLRTDDPLFVGAIGGVVDALGLDGAMFEEILEGCEL